jgi:ABC-2 type transport system permease protein
MFTGNASAADNAFDYLKDNWQDLPAILASAAVLSSLVASVGLAIASQTPRRAYSTVGILAAFLLVSAIAGSVFEAADRDTGRVIVLLSPFHLARGTTLWLFGADLDPDSQFARADLPGSAYCITAVCYTLVMVGLLLRRYRGLQA